MPNPVRWFEIYVQDMPRARRFYENVFLTQLSRTEATAKDGIEYWSFPSMSMDTPGSSGALVKMDGVPSGGMGSLVYFACNDCAVEAKRAEEFGGRIKDGKMSIGPHGFIALVYDTEGNLIGLHSMT
jgi:predicted enzyme related to lactoylglutathione lyase